MSRVFTFGCSFTSYQYPTYADYIGALFNTHVNMASAGSGNLYNFLSFVNAIKDFDINKDDCILFQTTGIPRHDFLNSSLKWNNDGNIGYQEDTKQFYGFSFINSTFYFKTLLNLLWSMKNEGYNIIIIPMLSYQYKENLGEIGYIHEFDENTESKYLFNTMNELYEIQRKIMIDTDIFTFQYECKEKQHRWYDVNTSLEVLNDDHPSTNTHLKLAKYLCDNYIQTNNMYRLKTDEINLLSSTWETFFQTEDLKQSNEYKKNIYHKKRLSTDLRVGWPNHLYNTQYQFVGYK